jgi:transketolase N-terminal domain/subunit
MKSENIKKESEIPNWVRSFGANEIQIKGNSLNFVKA